MLRPAERICLSKFRCGNHKLPISECRYDCENVPWQCTLCLTGNRGDEYHYVLVCSFFDKERRELVRQFYRANPNIYKFQKLMSSQKVKVLSNLMKLLKKILNSFS